MKPLVYIFLLIYFFTFTMLFAEEPPRLIENTNLSLSYAGKFMHHVFSPESNSASPNGRFWCQFEIGRVSDEFRDLKKFRFFDQDTPQFSRDEVPGSTVSISNSGIVAFMELTDPAGNELTIHFYTSSGNFILSHTTTGASLFGYSRDGNHYGVGNYKQLAVVNLNTNQISHYPGGYQFDLSETGEYVVIAQKHQIKIFNKGELIQTALTDFDYTRKICISEKNKFVAAIDKQQLKVFSLANHKLLFSDKVSGKKSFRDLRINADQILVGIQQRTPAFSKGILNIYALTGKILKNKEQAVYYFHKDSSPKKLNKSSLPPGKIPWPFMPIDSTHTVWNYYEQHMGYGNSSYLHQGLDIITPIAEPVYAVQGGIVKCVLTFPSNPDIYWRMAISDTQTADYSRGWLYAHLIEHTIQFDVGDTVQAQDYLGNIVHWAADWGHIHFVQIEDSGLVWQYDDNEWGITHNPLLSLVPNTDRVPPRFENVFPHAKFAFCENETSNYLAADSLFGEIDIIVKVVDYFNDSPWQLPAFKTFYWILESATGDTIFPRTLGQVLNHDYGFYESEHYTPYAALIYKRDDLLRASSWMSEMRNFYHLLTNNNGDTRVDLSETELAFATRNYPNGDYRIIVAAQDEYGNSARDSMEIKFRNIITDVPSPKEMTAFSFHLNQNFPNPFNATTLIQYTLPHSGVVALKIYDILGRKIKTLANEFQEQGNHTLVFNSEDLASGIYYYQIRLNHFSEVKKMVLLR